MSSCYNVTVKRAHEWQRSFWLYRGVTFLFVLVGAIRFLRGGGCDRIQQKEGKRKDFLWSWKLSIYHRTN